MVSIAVLILIAIMAVAGVWSSYYAGVYDGRKQERKLYDQCAVSAKAAPPEDYSVDPVKGELRYVGPKWIGVDFDGTLAFNHPPGDPLRDHDHDHGGVPIQPMVHRIRALLNSGRVVKILTARSNHAVVRAWCVQHLGQELAITREKNPGMIALFDDRAIRVERNTGRVCTCFPHGSNDPRTWT